MGHDSLVGGFTLCVEHRRCVVCHFTLTSQEIDYCREHGVELRHYRCMILARDGNGQKKVDIDLMNRVLLLISDPSLTSTFINQMGSFDQRYAFLQSVQAVAANASILLAPSKKEFALRLHQEAIEERRVKQQEKPNPIKQAAAVGITTTSEKVARHKLSERDKNINRMMKVLGYTLEEAELAQRDLDAMIANRHTNL